MLHNISIKEICTINKWKISIENEELFIDNLNLCNRFTEYKSILSYVTSEKYVDEVTNNDAIRCLIVPIDFVDYYKNIIINRSGMIIESENPEVEFYKLFTYLLKNTDFFERYETPAIIGNRCNIHPTAIINCGVKIGDDVEIGPYSVIKQGTVIGSRTTIGSCSVIGSDGFQIIKENGIPQQIYHVGRTSIGEDVFIGDNVVINKSLFEGFTHIGDNVKINSHAQIAHNCIINNNVVITGGVILCGSTIISEGAWIGANSTILNRVTIGENSCIGIGSVVTRNIDHNTIAYGIPARPKING